MYNNVQHQLKSLPVRTLAGGVILLFLAHIQRFWLRFIQWNLT